MLPQPAQPRWPQPAAVPGDLPSVSSSIAVLGKNDLGFLFSLPSFICVLYLDDHFSPQVYDLVFFSLERKIILGRVGAF